MGPLPPIPGCAVCHRERESSDHLCAACRARRDDAERGARAPEPKPRRKSKRIPIDVPIEAFYPPGEVPKEARIAEARRLVSNFKAPPLARDDDYLAFVREQPCCACGKSNEPSEAHHFGPRGMGERCSDYFAVPVCVKCHRQFHDEGKIECEMLMQRVRDHALSEDPPFWLARLVTEHAFYLAQSTLQERWRAMTPEDT
jgi:hypothetical protein